MNPDTSQTQICFFDLETFVPVRGQDLAIVEFGAILVCPRTLVELKSYSSLVRPYHLSSPSLDFLSRKGINPKDVFKAPSFSKIADQVHLFLHGRVWAGHNVEKFDCVIIREAFEKIGRPAPEPKGIIDSLTWPRLQAIFRLGSRNTGKSLDDVRMNLDVIKHCAAVLFLESSLPDVLTTDSSQQYPFDIENEGETELDVIMEEDPEQEFLDEMYSETDIAEDTSDYEGFVRPDEVFEDSISASLIQHRSGGHRIILLRDVALQLFCPRLRVHFEIREKYFDQHTGLPRLSFVVDASRSLCRVLDACDSAAKQTSEDIGSYSKWRPLVARDSTVRLHIINGDNIAQYGAEIHQKDFAGNEQKLEFSKFDVAELGSLLRKGTYVDAFLSLDTYDYNQHAGILLVAKKLVINW
ncbi:hypothetical protein PTKIN_Ptkin05aG0173400 [Pterospermum kingtungense]